MLNARVKLEKCLRSIIEGISTALPSLLALMLTPKLIHFQSPVSYGHDPCMMTHARTKNQGHRSGGSKVSVETNGWTDRRTDVILLPFMLMRSITIYIKHSIAKQL